MKTQKRKMRIFYLDKFGEESSIIQLMSKHVLGSWIWYFIDNGYNSVRIVEVKDNDKYISEND